MRHACFLPAVLALLLSPLCLCAADDWSVTPAARDGSSTANSHVLVIPNIIRKQTGYLTVTNNSCGHFAIVAAGSPSTPCGGITVSNFARHNRCVAAVNGGDFGWSKGWHTPLDQRCSLGIIVCNGSTWSAEPPPQPVFAMSSSCDIYVGNFPYSLFASAGITNAVSGQALIVLNGTAQKYSYRPSPSFNRKAVQSMSPRFDARPSLPHNAYHSRSSSANAPRTALGHDANGRIMTLQVDGDESLNTGIAFSRPAGATLAEMAELMVAAGAWSAIELDGGGSSTTVFGGRLMNHPTCIDLPFPQCERHVNSAVCILE